MSDLYETGSLRIYFNLKHEKIELYFLQYSWLDTYAVDYLIWAMKQLYTWHRYEVETIRYDPYWNRWQWSLPPFGINTEYELLCIWIHYNFSYFKFIDFMFLGICNIWYQSYLMRNNICVMLRRYLIYAYLHPSDITKVYVI